MKEKKIIIITSIIIGVLTLTLGVTFAIFNFSKVSVNSKLVLGDIYMHYNEPNQGINLENIMPSSTYNSASYFEFIITGKNTHTKNGILYNIQLVKGDIPADKTEVNRIQDKFLKFKLVEVVDGV